MKLIRSFIRDGDTTTVNGKVRVPPGTVTVGTPPKYLCFEGDPVDCPDCKTTGVTRCIPPFRPYTGPDGRQVNLDGDLCICACASPPRLKALFDSMWMEFEKHEVAAMAGSSGWLAYAGHQQAISRFDQFFVAHDKQTRQPVSGFSYGLKTTALEHHDTLYDDGATAKAYAEDAQNLVLTYLVQTSMGIRP
ncbi:PAAR domain-containing protein [Variovorax sp. J2P1-59]|uniref:PAAR domain-containing protein n=1 Tax=Variovorax flavidus TaxID=3053501 RepID=UPI002576DF26|nr:PAAR domain-containing protein [Variovorax sp. J2P1-59]MDM0077491.1 PAAR domain-containing protein [Variovorax sp. J2P1-59]